MLWRYWCRLCLKDDCIWSLQQSWPKPVGLMVNSSIFLSRCIFNREPRWKTFFISIESSPEQKRHRDPWNKCIYAAYSTYGMQCVPNRFQIASFVNVRPSLSVPMHFDLRRGTSFTPRVWCARRLERGQWASPVQSITIFSMFSKGPSKIRPVDKMGTINRKVPWYNTVQCTVITVLM